MQLHVAFLFSVFLPYLSHALTYNGKTVHTVFGTECGDYFNWQSIGMIYSHKKAGQPGPLTRLLSCTPEQAKSVKLLDVVNTHIAPSYTHNPHNNDVYSAYNKPESIISWLEKNDIKEEYVLILDADMIMRAPFTPDEFGAEEGRPVSAFYGYLKGVANALALKHVPEVPPTLDYEAGPYGRRGDQVGGFILMNTKDLRKMAPLWLSYAEKVRLDPDAWNLTGDVYAAKEPHSRPWISEMYGYSFGAAKVGLHHKVSHHAMLYPEYEPDFAPRVLHYGLLYNIPGTSYKFDKHWYRSFEPLVCALSEPEKAGEFLFPHPPRPSSLRTTGKNLLRDLLGIETPSTLNAAICWWHRGHCQMSEDAKRKCEEVDVIEREVEEAYRKLGAVALPAPGDDPCTDMEGERCVEWEKAGECDKNPAFMMQNCRKSCKVCGSHQASGTALKVGLGGRKEEEAPDLKGKAPVKTNASTTASLQQPHREGAAHVAQADQADRHVALSGLAGKVEETALRREGIDVTHQAVSEDAKVQQRAIEKGLAREIAAEEHGTAAEGRKDEGKEETAEGKKEDTSEHRREGIEVGKEQVISSHATRGRAQETDPAFTTGALQAAERAHHLTARERLDHLRHSLHLGGSGEELPQQPSITTGLAGALSKFARSSSVFFLFLVVLLALRSRFKGAPVRGKNPLLPTYNQMRGAGGPPGVYVPAGAGIGAGAGGRSHHRAD